MDMKTVDALACEFASTLRGWLTSAQWNAMRESNARHARNGESGYCASHNHCDANMAMVDAFATIAGREPDVFSDRDLSLMDVAWDRAKLQFLA